MPDFSSKSTVIQTFLDELSIGMLAMIRYHHGFISRLIREAVIEKMSFDLKIPFLVIPGGDENWSGIPDLNHILTGSLWIKEY